jgi:adenylate cyclase
MDKAFPFELVDDPGQLAALGNWSREVYEDLLGLQGGRLAPADFDRKYRYRKAILDLDMTGFTVNAIKLGELPSFLRIVDVQKVCLPIFRETRATLVRAFADDLVALFDDPADAVAAAFRIHDRIEEFNLRQPKSEYPTECCVGIGYGDVYAIGPNLAMGDEMNRASKLGEDTARGGETLVTEHVYDALRHRGDLDFDRQTADDLIFPFYRVIRR